MTTDNSPEQDQTTTEPPVRVPNVSPGAVSGLDHQPIGSNAQAAYDANQAIDAGTDPDSGEPLEPQDSPNTEPVALPEGQDLDGLVAWVQEAEDGATAKQRADAVWAEHQDGEDSDALSARLTGAMHAIEQREEQSTGGTPLDPPQPGADADGFGGDAPQPADTVTTDQAPDAGEGQHSAEPQAEQDADGDSTAQQ